MRTADIAAWVYGMASQCLGYCISEPLSGKRLHILLNLCCEAVYSVISTVYALALEGSASYLSRAALTA